MAERRTQEERRAATRGALVSAARLLFVEKGYVGSSQEEIVREAGVTRGALYHHFEDGKRGLFRGIVEEIEVEIDESVVAALWEEYERSGDMFEAGMAAILAYLEMCARADVRRIIFGDASAALGWEEWRKLDMAHGLPQIRQGLEAHIELGIIEDQPVEPLAHVCYGASVEAGMYVASSKDPEAAIGEMEVALRKFLDGMIRAK